MPTPSDPYEAMQHGYEVATLRAESRRRLGLPIERPAADDELRQLTHNYRCTLDQHAHV